MLSAKTRQKIERAEKVLWDKALPGVPDESKEDGKRGKLHARYVMQVLQNRNGTVVDSHHADWGRDHNIGLYDINSPLSMAKVEKSGNYPVPGTDTAGESSTQVLPHVPVRF